MRIHKRTTGKSYSIDFTDHLSVTHTLAGFTDKGATVELSRNLRRLVQCRAHHERPDPAVTLAMKTWPARIRKALLKWGIVDARRDAEAKLLADHLADFEQALLAKGTTVAHARQVKGRAGRVMKGCRFVKWSDIQASRVHRWLHDQQQDRKTKDKAGVEQVTRGLSAQTFNFYLANVKQFCRWMVRDGRAAESPVEHLDGLNVRTDRRHDRRALSVDEARRLLSVAEGGPDRQGVPGHERCLAYRLTLETGLRAAELRSLTRSSFDLQADPPTVAVEAGYSKRRRRDVLPMRPDTAATLAGHLARKSPAAPAFAMPRPDQVVVMLKADLAAAGIAYRDDADRVVDFHALRHTFITNLASSGVHPKVAQALARHSSITLTMDRYSHTLREQEHAAIAGLPDLSTPAESQQQQATGTHGSADAPQIVGPIVGIAGDSARTTTDKPAGVVAMAGDAGAKENPVNNGVCSTSQDVGSGEGGGDSKIPSVSEIGVLAILEGV